MKFELNKKQLKKFYKWKKSIENIYGNNHGGFIFKFQGTGIGEIVTVECEIVGPDFQLDLTDLESW